MPYIRILQVPASADSRHRSFQPPPTPPAPVPRALNSLGDVDSSIPRETVSHARRDWSEVYPHLNNEAETGGFLSVKAPHPWK